VTLGKWGLPIFLWQAATNVLAQVFFLVCVGVCVCVLVSSVRGTDGQGEVRSQGHGTIFFFDIPHTGDINRPALGVRDTVRRSRNKIFVRIRWLLLALPRGLSRLSPPPPLSLGLLMVSS